jgi:organic radical activating enzyme
MLNQIWFKRNYETFFITWSLHNLCNFRCDYCPPNLNNGTTKNISFEHVEKFYNSLKAKIPNKKFIFAFSGGEPTFHPEFIDMIKFLSDNGCEICMTTNGSRSLDWWHKAEPYVDHLVISYHPGWTKTAKLKENIDFLVNTTWVNLDLMMNPTHWDEIISLGDSYKNRSNIAVTYLPIQKDFGNGANGLIDYTDAQLEFLKNPPNYWGKFEPAKSKLDKCKGQFGRGYKYMKIDQDIKKLDYKYIVANDLNRFKGYVCDLGLEGLIVEINGDIYNAYCHVGGIVGNIFLDNYTLTTEPTICPVDYCSCSVDIEISKRKL